MSMNPARRDTAQRKVAAQAAHAAHAIAMTLHAVAACAVAYFASARWVTLASQVAHRLGLARADAVMLAVMLGFIALWLMLLWVFSRRSIAATWAWLLGLLALPWLADAALGGALGAAS